MVLSLCFEQSPFFFFLKNFALQYTNYLAFLVFGWAGDHILGSHHHILKTGLINIRECISLGYH